MSEKHIYSSDTQKTTVIINGKHSVELDGDTPVTLPSPIRHIESIELITQTLSPSGEIEVIYNSDSALDDGDE